MEVTGEVRKIIDDGQDRQDGWEKSGGKAARLEAEVPGGGASIIYF